MQPGIEQRIACVFLAVALFFVTRSIANAQSGGRGASGGGGSASAAAAAGGTAGPSGPTGSNQGPAAQVAQPFQGSGATPAFVPGRVGPSSASSAPGSQMGAGSAALGDTEQNAPNASGRFNSSGTLNNGANALNSGGSEIRPGMAAGNRVTGGLQGRGGGISNGSGAFGSSGTSAASRALQSMSQGTGTNLMQGNGAASSQMFGGTAASGQGGGNVNAMGAQSGRNFQNRMGQGGVYGGARGAINSGSYSDPGTGYGAYGNVGNFGNGTGAAQRSNYAPNAASNRYAAPNVSGIAPNNGKVSADYAAPNRYGNVQNSTGVPYNDRTAVGTDPNTPIVPTPADPNGWRFVNQNGNWWYWMPGQYWMSWNGSNWNRYSPPTSNSSTVSRPLPVGQ